MGSPGQSFPTQHPNDTSGILGVLDMCLGDKKHTKVWNNLLTNGCEDLGDPGFHFNELLPTTEVHICNKKTEKPIKSK